MAKLSEGIYPISQVAVEGVYPVDGRRYIVYETMLDSFNNQPAIAVQSKGGTIQVKFVFVPVGLTLVPKSNLVPCNYLSDWSTVVNASRPPVGAADRPRLKFAEIPAAGAVAIADDRGHEQIVAQ